MIDKSIRQHYQTGEKVDPYRKGLEMIAGKGKGTFQTTAPTKITAKSLFQPPGKITLPSVKTSGKAQSIGTLPTITPPSPDLARYSGLLNILPKEEGSYLDKYINRKPVRIVERAAKPSEYPTDVHPGIEPHYLTSSFVQDTFPGIDIATTLDVLPTKGEVGDTAYSDTQIKNIVENATPDEKNFMTTILKTANDTIEDLGLDKTKIATNLVKNKVGKVVATELGISSGAAGGPIGMLIGWLVGKAVDKFTGGKKEETEEIEGIFSLADKGSTDKPVDKPTVEDTAATEDIITAPPKPKPYSPPARPHGGGGNGGGGGWSGSGGRSDDSWSSSPFLKGGRVKLTKGGRVDKPFTGRSRDI